MNEPLIELKDVSKRFGEQTILKDASLSIYQGQVTTIIGKSGVGKSVLLKHIIGLMEPDSGQVLFLGQPLSKMNKGEQRTIKRKFSYMFQNTALFDSMTVFENIALPLKERTSLPEGEIQRLVLDMMRRLDLHKIDEKYPSQLSGGMKKRVALARALITDPETVLFDEPTTGLDPIRKNAVHNMISDYQKKFGFTAVVVSHEIPDVFYISQRIAMLEAGKILFEGTPEEIQQVSDPEVQQFVQGLESRHDVLTGMVPQPQAEQKFREEMGRLQRHHIAFSLILFTLENLDEINEKAGYATGQTLLKDFAKELQKRLRISDTCARYGLNKIIAVLPHTDKEQARLTCAKLARELKMQEIIDMEPYPGFHFSVSAGFAEAREDKPLEHVLVDAESRKNMLYEFRVSHNGEHSIVCNK
jgi:phospholipid/cholesterol/gamma-HCH transport system ATP-binding protein